MQRAVRYRPEVLHETVDWEGTCIIEIWNESLPCNDAWSFLIQSIAKSETPRRGGKQRSSQLLMFIL